MRQANETEAKVFHLPWANCGFGKPLDGYEFSTIGRKDFAHACFVVDGCGVASGCFISVVFST
jgi:hypothetical protein